MTKRILAAGAIIFGFALRAERIDLTTVWAKCSIETDGARVLSFCGPDGKEALWNATPLQLPGTNLVPSASCLVPGAAGMPHLRRGGILPPHDAADAPSTKWAHGGIPVCWPWFSTNGDIGIHGTAWHSPFTVVSRSERKDRCELVLARDEGDVRIEYTLVLRDTLKLELKTINRGKSDFHFSAGFHPYFLVGERDQVEIAGVTPNTIPVTHAMDDAYPTQPGSCSIFRLHDKSMDRTMYLFFENVPEVNIWNPGPTKTDTGTLASDSWRHFVCVEPMLGQSEKPVTLRAGDSVTFMLGIDVRKGSKQSGYVGQDPRRPQAAEEPTGRPFHLLYLGAHPDDFDYTLSAQAVKMVRNGAKVTAVAFCNGCKGHVDMTPEALAARRLKEAQSAAKIYGLERYIVLECPDCELDATRAWRERIGRLVRDIAPDMVLTHRTVDYHADHRAVGLIVQDLTYFLGVPHWCPDTPVPEKLPFVMYAVDDFTSPRRVRPDLVMSGAGAVEEGSRGLACHVSQLFEWMPPELGDDPAKLKAPDVRAAYALKLTKDYYLAHAKAYADVLEKNYGNREEPASVAELSEYSRAPSARELEVLEAIPGFKWIGSRTLDILH